MADGVCSITGGYVVRDPGLPTLAGRYLYGDLCVPEIQSATTDGEPGTGTGMLVSSLVSFGQDACGRLYTVSLSGPVSRIRDGAGTSLRPARAAAPSPAPGPGGTPRPPAPAVVTAADRTAPRLSVRRSARQRVRGARAVKLIVTVSEPATVRTSLRVPGVATLRSASYTLAPGIPGVFRISTQVARGKRLRSAVARRSRRGDAHGDCPRRRRERVAGRAPGAAALATSMSACGPRVERAFALVEMRVRCK